jgi:hydroxymethylbilane synthase
VAAERGVLVALEGDCKTPIAAYAEKIDARMRLRAFIAEPDGGRLRADDRTLPWPDAEDDAHRIGLEMGRTLKGR